MKEYFNVWRFAGFLSLLIVLLGMALVLSSRSTLCINNDIENMFPDTLKINLPPLQLANPDSVSMENVFNYLKNSDEMMRAMYKVNMQTSAGTNQLRLFLKNPCQDTYIYIGGCVLLCFIVLLILQKPLKHIIKKAFVLSSLFFVFVATIVVLALLNLSIGLKRATMDDIDTFFVSVFFFSIGLFLMAFCMLFYKLMGKDIVSNIRIVREEHRRNTLLWAAIVGWSLAYLIFFVGMYLGGTQKSALAAIIRPAFSASKMFFMADSPSDLAAGLRQNGAFMGFYILVKLYVLVITTITLLSLVFNRWKSYLETKMETANKKQLFVFFGITRASVIMARNIKEEVKDKDKRVLLFVENRKESADLFKSLSFSSVLGLFRHRPEAYETVDDLGARLVISHVMMSSPECSDLLAKDQGASIKQIMKCLGLGQFHRLAEEAKEVHCFFMYDDQNINISGSYNLRKLLNKSFFNSGNTFKIHCWARQGAKTQILEVPEGMTDHTEINILDISRLSVQSLLQSPENHPVQFVDVDTSTATVSSDFRAIIVGFGETGQDALRFVYEFGAFLDSHCADINNQLSFRSPFHCDVIDKDMETLRPLFLSKTPALTSTDSAYNMQQAFGEWTPNKYDPLVSFHTGALNSNAYIQLMEKKLATANYIVLALGNDELNLRALNDLMAMAVKLRNGDLKRMRIFVRCYSSEYSKVMKSQEDYYNQMFSETHPVKMFGSEKSLFSFQYVVDDQIIDNAKDYYQAYKDLKQDPQDTTWDARHNDGKNINRKKRSSVKRKEQQDINNFLHMETKLKLIGECNPKELANAILFINEGKDFTYVDGTPESIKTLYNNLARTEHLRWNASHEMLGYIMNEGTGCNEMNKTHNCLVPWEMLPMVTERYNKKAIEEGWGSVDYQAYDYLVVKTTFEMAITKQ